MANLKFLGTENTDGTSLELYVNKNNELFIIIEEAGSYPSFITLDKETAKELIKKLKAEIKKME